MNPRQMNRNIQRVAMIPMVGFVLLCLFLGYWQIVRAPELRASEYNTRGRDRLAKIEPGDLLDRDGEKLMGATREEAGWKRTYPEGESVSHLTGYNDRSGLQRGMRDALLGIGPYESPWAEFAEGPLRGNDVTLTVDLEAQELATRLLRGERGAAVALDARTGAVLALVSAPGYEPEGLLESQWDYQMFQNDPRSPELNRALQGLYPPGSVLKIMSAAIALDLDRVNRETEFTCERVYRVNGAAITCPRAHGRVTLDEALQVSCNTTFAKLGEFVSADEFAEYANRFLLLENAGLPLASNAGRIGEFTGDNRNVLLAESLFGQGQMQVTPLAIARMTLMIAGGGSAPKPYLVERVAGPSGRTLYRARPQQMEAAVSAETAATVAGMMVNVVEEGTGQVASLSGVEVAGKTGSAENPHGQAHSWFTAFAPAEAPQVVVTVVVENAGAGSEAAGPIVSELMEYLLD